MAIIREYTNEDWEAVSNIYDLGKADEMRGVVNEDEIIPLAEDDHLRQYFNDSQVWVYEVAETVAGFIGLKGDVLSWLFVHPDYRRHGIGTDLMNVLLDVTDTSLRLNVVKSNIAAFTLYQAFGFVIAKEFEGNMYGKKIPAVMMVLERNLDKS